MMVKRPHPGCQFGDRQERYLIGSSRPQVWGRDFTLTVLGTFTFFASFFYLLSVLPDYIGSIGGAKWQVGAIVSGFSAIPLVLRPFAGRWSDRGGRKRLMRVGFVVTAASLALMALSADVLSLFALRVVQGIGAATFPTAAGSIVAEVTPESRRGGRAGSPPRPRGRPVPRCWPPAAPG